MGVSPISKKIYIFSLLFILEISRTFSSTCGPNYFIPNGPEDCVGYSSGDRICCYLEMQNSHVDYKICYSMLKEDFTPIITNGQLTYKIDCTGISDLREIFPLGQTHTACGIQEPISASDCWAYSTNKVPCCIAGEDLSTQEDLFCYFFPESKLKPNNFTTSVDNKKFYVSCGSLERRISAVLFVLVLLLF